MCIPIGVVSRLNCLLHCGMFCYKLSTQSSHKFCTQLFLELFVLPMYLLQPAPSLGSVLLLLGLLRFLRFLSGATETYKSGVMGSDNEY
jgi:hypothetical protein